MNAASAKRPPILTGACFYLGLLSAVMSVRAITLVSSWNSENRAADVAIVLRALRDAGLSADGAETFYRTFLTVLAVLAAAGVVFAVFTAQGDRASRVGITVAIGVVGLATFAGALGATFFMAMLGLVAVAFTIRLWTGEVGAYFRTLAGHPAPSPEASQPSTPVAVQTQLPPDHRPFVPRRDAMPRSVSIVVWTTLAGSALVALGAALGLLVLGIVGDDYEQILRDSPLSQSMLDGSSVDYDQMYRASLAVFGVCLALSLGGLTASVIALVKRRRGGVFLFVMAVVTVITSMLMFPFGIPWTAAAVVAIVQLRKPDARAWFTTS
jgi:hypothetical protein